MVATTILPQNRVSFKIAAVCFPPMSSVGSSCGADLAEVEPAVAGGACAGVAIAAVDVSTVDFTALVPGKFKTIGNELDTGNSGHQVRARVVFLAYPRCIAPLEAVFEQLASSKACVGARGVVATHSTHPRTFYRKSERQFLLKRCA